MSTHFTVHCLTHEVAGPDIRRSAGQTGLISHEPDDRYTTGQRFGSNKESSDAWSEFLIDHEWCPLVLIHEGQTMDYKQWHSQI